MRNVTSTCLSLILACAAPATSFGWQSPDPTPDVEVKEIDAFLDGSVHDLSELVATGGVTPGAIDATKQLIDAWISAAEPDLPDASEVRDRMNRYMAHLENVVRTNFLRYRHVAELREELVEMRLDRALAILEKRARSGNWTSQQYFSVVRLFHERADAAVESPGAEEVRQRLESMLVSVMSRGFLLGAELRQVQIYLTEARLERKLAQRIDAFDAGEDTSCYTQAIAALVIDRQKLIDAQEDWNS